MIFFSQFRIFEVFFSTAKKISTPNKLNVKTLNPNNIVPTLQKKILAWLSEKK